MNNKEQIEKHFRFEFKYVLDPVTYIKVRDFVESIGIEHDTNVSTDVYTVTSLYYDTHGIDDYYDKSAGVLKRKKVRARIYGSHIDENVKDVHLETKNKHDMYIGKKRIKVDVNTYLNSESTKELGDFGLNIKKEGRVPTVIVRYEREAFVEPFFSRVRLTFDKNIEAIRHDSLELESDRHYDTIPVSDVETVMEIKFNQRLPWWFGFMVKKFDLKRTAYSKYAHAMDRLYMYNPLPR